MTMLSNIEQPAIAGDADGGPAILPFVALTRDSIPLAGGKGANLGELTQAGFPVPPGFCLLTRAYREVAASTMLEPVLAALAGGGTLASAEIVALATQAREAILAAAMPDDIRRDLLAAYKKLGASGEQVAVAVRSSATAEDLPDASFAGQQETFLNIIGEESLIDAVRHCWASLWTDRAVAYRRANGVDNRQVALAVVVQEMVPAAISGVLFTANPLTNRRQEAVIDATPGLGEALVSGMVNPSHYIIDTAEMRITTRRVEQAQLAIGPRSGGGTEEVDAGNATLSDKQALDLARLGARVEAHYAAPMDIEWSIDPDGRLWLLQARQITTLFPAPPATSGANKLDVYFSFNVAQGVLQPITPFGVDWIRHALAGMAELAAIEPDPKHGPDALISPGGWLYLRITLPLRSALGRRVLGPLLTNMEPRSGDIVRGLLDDPRLALVSRRANLAILPHILHALRRTRLPLHAISGMIMPRHARRVALRDVRRFLAFASEPAASPQAALEKVDWIAKQVTRRVLARLFPPALISGNGAFQLIRRLAGSEGATDALLLTRGLPHNPTTQMNLALWSLSRHLRGDLATMSLLTSLPAADLAASYLRGTLPVPLQKEVRRFLGAYGFRGVAEIDAGQPRWSDDPTYIFSILAGFVKQPQNEQSPDEQFRRAEEEATGAINRLVQHARRRGPRGYLRAALMRFLFGRMRELFGLREAPKFYLVATIGQGRRLYLQVGAALAAAQRLKSADDVFFVSIEEAGRGLDGEDLRALVSVRRAEYRREMKRRRVPRVLLSDGTALYGDSLASAAGEAPGTLTGTPASPGVYTGRARVVLDPANAELEPGEILVAPSTDPGWTPLFLSAGALVVEMGGMMSHGAVVAREYGIPAVVGLPGATSAIRTGQRITVDGHRGVVLPEQPSSTNSEARSSGA